MKIEAVLERYRPNVGVVLFDARGKVWFGRRISDFADLGEGPDGWRWQFPQGGIDDGENVAEAAFRELKEETGVSSARLLALTPGWLPYDFPPGYRKKNWKGQRQKYAIMMFEGEDAEIDLEADDHQEFDDWRWGELEDAPGLIVPFKRHVYEDLVASLAPLRDYLRGGR